MTSRSDDIPSLLSDTTCINKSIAKLCSNHVYFILCWLIFIKSEWERERERERRKERKKEREREREKERDTE